MNRMKFLANVLCLGALAFSVGCGGSEVAETDLASAEESFSKAVELVKAGDHASALPLLDAAIAGDGLNVDLYTEAVLYRAQAYAFLGEAEKADADLQEAEMGAPDEALWHYSKGVVLSKAGKTSEASKEFSAAKRLDPSLKPPK